MFKKILHLARKKNVLVYKTKLYKYNLYKQNLDMPFTLIYELTLLFN